MISVILSAQQFSASQLAHTLQNLLSHAVDGLVVEVTLMHDGLDEQTARLADEAGCNLANHNDDFVALCKSARGQWLLFLEPGAELQSGWDSAVEAHMRANRGAAQFKLVAPYDYSLWKRIFMPITRKSPLAKGLFISKRQALANGKNKATSIELMRGLAMTRLKASVCPPQN